MTFTLAITNYNRYEMLLESFTQVILDPRIDEILIMDDASDALIWNKVKDLGKYNPIVKVVRQLTNRGMSINKRDAIFNSRNEWVIIFDSDNIITSAYIDAIPRLLGSNTIYAPSFAKPNFDYTSIAGNIYSASNIPNLNNSTESCAFNTANYLVHKETYLEVFKENQTVRGVDTLWFNYLWLKSGNKIQIVPGMEYDHRVHEGSEYMKHIGFNMEQAKEFQKLIEAI